MFLSSLYFALLAKLKIRQTTDTYSPQTFSVTAAVVISLIVNTVLYTVNLPAMLTIPNSYCLFVRVILLLQ